jgi:hypothetical protein
LHDHIDGHRSFSRAIRRTSRAFMAHSRRRF